MILFMLCISKNIIVYYSEYSLFMVGDYVPKWLPKWASQLKTIMSDLRLRNGNFPFRNRKGCELGLYICIIQIVLLMCGLLLLLFCVYLDCQIARPSFWMGATLCCVWAIKSLCGIFVKFLHYVRYFVGCVS